MITILYMQASESCVHQSSPVIADCQFHHRPVAGGAGLLLLASPAHYVSRESWNGSAVTCILQSVLQLKGHTATCRLKIMVSSVWRKVR